MSHCPRWSPWVANGGWHWQLYHSTADDNANTFGIFDGRPSQLLGAQSSSAGLYTEAVGVSDLHSSCDDDGNCQLVWQSQGELWYKKINADGTSEESMISLGQRNPFVFTEGENLNILAVSSLGEASLFKKNGAANFQIFPLDFDATINDPFLYGASNSTHDFILFQGTRNGQTGLLLYSAISGSTAFTFADILPLANAFRSANRADVQALPSGDILVAYAENGFTQSFNLIQNGTTQFSTVATQPFGGGNTFGMAIDKQQGKLFWIDGNGAANLASLTETNVDNVLTGQVAAKLNHQGAGFPNRRSIAFDEDGNALAHHEGEFFHFDFASQNWTKLSASEWQGIDPARVHFHDEFKIFGRKNGRLAQWNWDGTNTPILSAEFPDTERPSAGVQVSHNRISPSNSYHPDIRFEWGIFAGTKGDDLAAVDEVNPIAHTMNRLSGLANRLDEYENTPAEFSDAFHDGSIYISSQALETLINRVQKEEGFYEEMVTIDPGFRPVMDAWRDETSAKTNELFQEITNYAEELKAALTTGDGIYSFYHLYTTGGNEIRRRGALATGLLADDKLTTAQREILAQKTALFARILWDDDFVPFYLEHGLNLGTPNMLPQFRGYRWFFALLLTPDPEFADRAMAIVDELHTEFDAQLNDAGAPQGTPHYLQPALENLIFPALQLRNQGISDEFADHDKIRKFADFVLHLQTPPSARFGGHRKLICFGDGTEEGAAIFGLLATGFQETDEALSQRLMHAYRNGPARATDFGFVTLAIDHDLVASNRLKYGSGHFPGYLSTFRSATGQAEESATWFVNGDWFFDHRNDDRGAFSAYALGAPLALSPGTFYSPYAPGGHMKNIVIPASTFPDWNNQFGVPFLLPQKETWTSSEVLNFTAFGKNGRSKARFFGDFGNWTREVFHFAPNANVPIIVMRDSMSSGSQFIWNMNFITDGEVETPSFTFDPPARKWDYISGPFEQPVSSGEIGLPSGNFHRFLFSGQNWPTHPNGGIDIEFYTASINEASSTISEWAHTFTPLIEANEYMEANGQAFEERFQTLRIISDKAFFTIMVPYGKGQRPDNMVVNRSGDTLTVIADEFDFWTDFTASTYMDNERKMLTIFDAEALEYENASIAGGSMEMEILAPAIYVRLHGESGLREVQLPPGNWELSRPSPDANFNSGTGKWELNFQFQGNLNNSYSGGYAEFMFTKKVKLQPKILLQGAYNESTGLLNDDLRSNNLLPSIEPYSDLAYGQIWGGDEQVEAGVFNVIGDDAIVDWLLLELRSADDPTQAVSTRNALLQRDGDVVDMDGISAVEFYAVPDGEYYISFRHRNHIDVMTAEPISLNENVTIIDLTSAAFNIWGNDSRTEIGGDKWALSAGDLDASNNIDSTDRIAAWNERGLAKYHIEDVNLNGIANSEDKELIWMNRNLFGLLP